MCCAVIYLTILRSKICLLLTNMAFGKGSLRLRGRLTETQLISALDDSFSSLDKRIRTDVLLIDFSKAFDSVRQPRLLLTLNYYGITGNSLFWIRNFLLDRTQCVQVSRTRPSWISATSGVPQRHSLDPPLNMLKVWIRH